MISVLSHRIGEDKNGSLKDVLTLLCCVPREDICCTLMLALSYAAHAKRERTEFWQQANEIRALPINQRWELGQWLVESLSEAISTKEASTSKTNMH